METAAFGLSPVLVRLSREERDEHQAHHASATQALANANVAAVHMTEDKIAAHGGAGT